MNQNIDLNQVEVKKIIVHRVGNKFRDEGLLLSEAESKRTNELDVLLIKKFLIPVINSGEEYNLTHESDINLNVLKKYSTEIFVSNNKFFDSSIAIAKHLYSCSTHPNITEGEFIEILYDGIKINDTDCQAIGLFKVESKSQYLDVKTKEGALDIVETTGIAVDNIQKGVVILSFDNSAFVIDNLSKKSKYWLDDFIKATIKDTTKKYTKVVSDIVKAVSKKIESPSKILNFSDEISNRENFTINEIKKLSEDYLEKDEIDSIVKGIEVKHNAKFDNDFKVEESEVKKYIKDTISKTKLTKGVNLVISEPNTKLISVEMETTDFGYRAVLEIQKGE